jgi:hypothetical protein
LTAKATLLDKLDKKTYGFDDKVARKIEALKST